MTPGRIIFVYNADDGLFNALNDWAHKFFSPETYECALCRYTYSLTGKVRRWKQFIESLERPAIFLHRTDFRHAYPQLDLDLPVILVEAGSEPEVLMSSGEIAAAGSLDGLMHAVTTRLSELARK